MLTDLGDSVKWAAYLHKDCSITFKMHEFTNNKKLSRQGKLHGEKMS